jgi:RNA polymerase sigma-70 factor (ECF subfamily)
MLTAHALSLQAHAPLRARARERLEAMVERHHDELWRFLRHLSLSDSDVDEAIQEVLLVTAQKLSRVCAGSERAFLMGTAYRVARRLRGRQARAQNHETNVELIADAPTPDAEVDSLRLQALARRLLESMPIELASVFVLYEVEELTTREIAECLGIPHGTVASRLRRARREFKAHVARVEARQRFKERVG